MIEEISIERSGGPIKLLGGKHESALLLNEELIQFTFLREIGSTWRYQIAKNLTDTDIIKDVQFRNFVKHGFLQTSSSESQFSYIVNKLAVGKYRLEVKYIDAEIDLLDPCLTSLNFIPKSDYFHFDTYGGLVEVIATQLSDNESIIKEYTELIKKNIEPIAVIISTEDAYNTFLLDGHHKFLAYSRLKRPVRVLSIIKLDPLPIDKNTGLEFLKMSGSRNTEYKNRFLDR